MSIKPELKSNIRQKSFSLSFDGPVRAKSFTGGDNLKFVFKDSKYDEAKTFRFIGTSEAKDRDNEIVLIDAWDFSNYKNNPITLWGHENRSLPIGKTVAILKDEVKKVIYFDIEFSESYDFAKTVKGLVEEGILRATSVGFRVNDWEWDEKSDALVFTKTELFEISIVNVPANQDAVIQDSKDLAIEEIKSAEADLANVIEQLRGDVESLRNQLQALNPSSNPESEPEPVGAGDETVEELPKTETDEGKEEVKTEVVAVLDDNMVAQIVAQVLAGLQAQAKVEEPEEEQTSEDEEEPKEEEGSAPESIEEGLVVVSIDELSETESFVIVTEEEN